MRVAWLPSCLKDTWVRHGRLAGVTPEAPLARLEDAREAELDVQVPDERGRPDLDNIMERYIVPAASEELVQAPRGYVHGYRIYTVKLEGLGRCCINVKVMPEEAIQKFDGAMGRGLDDFDPRDSDRR